MLLNAQNVFKINDKKKNYKTREYSGEPKQNRWALVIHWAHTFWVKFNRLLCSSHFRLKCLLWPIEFRQRCRSVRCFSFGLKFAAPIHNYTCNLLKTEKKTTYWLKLISNNTNTNTHANQFNTRKYFGHWTHQKLIRISAEKMWYQKFNDVGICLEFCLEFGFEWYYLIYRIAALCFEWPKWY